MPRYSEGDSMHVVRGVQTDYKKLYYSDERAARKVPVTLRSGYGKIEAGTPLAVNKSASTDGKYVPYNPTTFNALSEHPGKALILAASGTSIDVTLEDSYKFAVGDDLIINDDNTSAENLGAITAIDRTTYSNKAVITVTSSISGAFAAANYAYVCIEAGTSDNNYSDCVGILEKTVDTGTGANAAGAQATMILGNAVLYNGVLTLVDSACRTDLGATVVGQYLDIP